MSRLEVLERIGRGIGANELAKVEDRGRPAQPGRVSLSRFRVGYGQTEIFGHAKKSCTPQNGLRIDAIISPSLVAILLCSLSSTMCR